MNKVIKFIGYIGVHVLVAVELFIIALLLTSPVFNLLIGVLDIMNCVPEIIIGKYLLAWIICSSVTWLILCVYVEIRTHDLTTDFKKK